MRLDVQGFIPGLAAGSYVHPSAARGVLRREDEEAKGGGKGRRDAHFEWKCVFEVMTSVTRSEVRLLGGIAKKSRYIFLFQMPLVDGAS